MKNYYFLLLNLIITAIVFFSVANFTNDYAISIITGLVCAALQTTFFLFYSFYKSSLALTKKILFVLVYLLFLSINYLFLSEGKTQGQFQKKALLDVRYITDTEICRVGINSILIFTMDKYYNGNIQHLGLKEIFNNHIITDSLYTKNIDMVEEGGFVVTCTFNSNSEIIIIAQHTFTKGKDSNFKNNNGELGYIEARATLSKNGIYYEQRN